MESGILPKISLFWTMFYICILTISVDGLLAPMCTMDVPEPHADEVLTLTCKMAAGNDSSENVTLTWYHDGQSISIDNRGIVRVKLSEADYGVVFTCEAREADTVPQSCTVTPLPLKLSTQDTNPRDTNSVFSTQSITVLTTDVGSSHPHDGTIMIIFIAICVAGGTPILIVIIGCIVWVSRKTKSDHRSYTLRPMSDSFDDYDVETAVDNRPAAPLPGEMKAMQNGNPPVQKEQVFPTYSNPPAESSENLYQNTAMGQFSTLPVASTGKNIYLVPKSTPVGSKEDLSDDNAKLYENTGFGSKQDRFEADQTASLPNFKY